jgi:hypothetical protein
MMQARVNLITADPDRMAAQLPGRFLTLVTEARDL